MRLASIIVLLTAITASCYRAGIVWGADYGTAVKTARRANRPLLIDFSASWCGPCREMERTTFQDRAVLSQMSRFVCVRVDIDSDPETAKRFGVNAIPRVIVVNAGGRQVLDSLGYRAPGEFRGMLAAALSGRQVKDSGGPQSLRGIHSADLEAMEAHLKAGDYAKWRVSQPDASRRGLRTAVEQLGSFEAGDRDKAAGLLAAANDDGIAALLEALTDPRLAVRVAAHDALTRIFTDKQHAAPAAIPRYDPWAPAAQRSRMAKSVREWWRGRRATQTRA